MTDPFQYLEDLDSPASLAWVDAQNAQTRSALDADPRTAPLTADILATLRDTRQIPYCSEHGGWLYHFHQSAENPRGVYRRTTWDSYRAAQTAWDIVLDIDALAAAEQVDWYLDGVDHCTLAPERCLITLSPGGSDATVCREYDVATRTFVAGGFHFPLGKSDIAWRDPDSVFVCPAWDDDQLTESGYSREAVLLQRGQDWGDALSLLALEPDAMMVSAWRFLDADQTPFDVIEASLSFYQKAYFHIDAAGDISQLKLPPRGELEAFSHGELLLKLDMDWKYHGTRYPAGSLLAIRANAQTGELGAATLLFAPAPEQSYVMLEATLNGLAVIITENVQSRLLTFRRAGEAWEAFANPLPHSGVIEFVDQPWQSDVLVYNFSDFLTPAGLYRYDLSSNAAPELLRAQPPAFDATPFAVLQHHASSRDGTPIPYFLVAKSGIELDGNTPTLLYGYGGFALPMMPYYLDHFGKQWLEQGGAFVLANIRGGGEFGPAWHEAALKEKRQTSFDDFIAVAEDLVARGVTSARRLGIEGGSNGGLLVGACLVQRPELFNAVVCEVPLLDMLRYAELHAGASWLDEYGDPDDEAEGAALAAYSPYHHIAPATERRYPRTLFTTSTQDDRVHPAHARKMVAKLHALGQPALFFETGGGGHGGNTAQEQTAEELARVLVYLYQQLLDD
ncbi:prolyl oligopeptidase family serine peptidase [Chitinilyticum piscinae]|uniref:S9 family peptidase n=1 Tax=Chitinilyticum piscinae TaxID=2866724 RepID=A0A8J7KD42_9NEIS|nr:prolyl oligopeptidase family serine peptidase [Chitinilyticum piscinae]MBE9608409.1 S9 family peptidase [Chitinilyticum piscinae]